MDPDELDFEENTNQKTMVNKIYKCIHSPKLNKTKIKVREAP